MAEANPENGTILCDYISAELTERNIADSSREWSIKVLAWLSKCFQHKKSFKALNIQYLKDFGAALKQDDWADRDEWFKFKTQSLERKSKKTRRRSVKKLKLLAVTPFNQ